MSAPSERFFSLGQQRIAALEWGKPGGLPVLALHGWLDNAASFDAMASALVNTDQPLHLLALDMPGHGHSDHRGNRQPYNIWEDVGDVFRVADELGWQNFCLLGHSRGAIVSFLCAGTFPERISHLALIDGLCPPSALACDTPATLAQSIIDCGRLAQTSTRYRADIAEFIAVFQQARPGIGLASATTMALRNLQQSADGWSWRTDPYLKTGSAMRLGREQIEAFAGRIKAPLLLFIAGKNTQSLAYYRDILTYVPNHRVENVPGNHHLHVDEAPLTLATACAKWFGLDQAEANHE